MAKGPADTALTPPSRPPVGRLVLAIAWIALAGTTHAQEAPGDGVIRAPKASTERGTEEATEAQFLAFLEYLGSWDESDEEWQAFHPDEGLSEIRLPATGERNVRGTAEGNEDTWDEKGRS